MCLYQSGGGGGGPSVLDEDPDAIPEPFRDIAWDEDQPLQHGPQLPDMSPHSLSLEDGRRWQAAEDMFGCGQQSQGNDDATHRRRRGPVTYPPDIPSIAPTLLLGAIVGVCQGGRLEREAAEPGTTP